MLSKLPEQEKVEHWNISVCRMHYNQGCVFIWLFLALCLDKKQLGEKHKTKPSKTGLITKGSWLECFCDPEAGRIFS
jgi:hypothetical protein